MSTITSTFPNSRKEYFIRSVRAGTVMDVDTYDRQCMKIVANINTLEKKSQRWKIEPVSHGSEKYCIRNVEKMEERRAPCYLGTCSDKGEEVLALVESEHKWEIEFKGPEVAVQIIDCQERRQHAAELKGGNLQEGTPVLLARLENRTEQFWIFVEV